jgi:hypothetical protein
MGYIMDRHKIQPNVSINIDPNFNPFICLRKTTKEARLRNVQYKILHNIYPTMHHLFKWKIKESENCSQCGVPETTTHAIFDCRSAQSTIKNLEMIIMEVMQINIHLTLSDILLGLNHETFGNKGIHIINVIIIQLKRQLILQREEKNEISTNEIRSLLENQHKMEKYIAIGSSHLRVKTSVFPFNKTS